MGELYDKVRKTPLPARRRVSLPLAVGAAVLVLMLIAALIIRPGYEYRRFLRFLGDLSTDTVYATSNDCLRCERDGRPTLRISLENGYAVYNKILASGRGTRCREIPEEGGILLDYGDGATLRLWPRSFTGSGRSEGILVVYTDPAGKIYAYTTNRVTYSNIIGVLTEGNNALWDE